MLILALHVKVRESCLMYSFSSMRKGWTAICAFLHKKKKAASCYEGQEPGLHDSLSSPIK